MIRAMATDPTSRMTPARARRPGRTAWRLALGLAALVAAAYAATVVMEIPPPQTLWRLEAYLLAGGAMVFNGHRCV